MIAKLCEVSIPGRMEGRLDIRLQLCIPSVLGPALHYQKNYMHGMDF
jgi:hypothetical protein